MDVRNADELEKAIDAGLDLVIYDGDCSFCQRQIERLRRRDIAGRFAHVPRQIDGLEQHFPRLAQEDFNTGMRLIESDGSMYASADAVHRITRKLPRWKRLAWLYHVPGLHWLAQRIYAWIAMRRFRLGRTCKEESCRVTASPGSGDGRR